MIFIAHRGNTNGSDPMRENRTDHILDALNKGYQVEIDVWYVDKQWWLGHNEPRWKTGTTIFKNAWCHAKNVEALEELKKLKAINYFWHNNDEYTLTSLGMILCKAGSILIPNSICVLPERGYKGDINKCRGICSDFISEWTLKRLK